MRYLVPHAVIVLAMLLLGRVPESLVLVLFFGGHLAVPIWAAWVGPRRDQTRAMLLGPVLVIAVHVVLLVAMFIGLAGGFPEDTWLGYMLAFVWLAALAIYIAYSVIAFGIVARFRR
jgi:hypothetical protein